MATEPKDTSGAEADTPKVLTPAARRALEEAAMRRAEIERSQGASPSEIGGREGPDPIRYGDWEKDGIASDF